MRTSTFTSYINVEPDQAIDAKFAALERQAQQTFSKIAASAQKANTAMSARTGGGMLGGSNPAVMQAQARALRDVEREQQRVAAAVARTSTRMSENSLAVARARREMGGFERTLRTTATTLNVVQGPLGPIAGRVGALAAAVGELTGFRLGLAGTGAALFALTSQANRYTEIRSRLVPLFEAQTDVNKAMRETVRIANEARTGLAPVADLYARLTLGGREFGISQQRIARITEIAAKAAKLSGGAQVSQDAGLYQFAQGIGSGTLAGDELKSIRENTLRLAKAIADGLDVPIGKLKELGKEGKLTPKVVADALEREAARIDAELERLPETLSSASAKFSTALNVMIGEQDQALGFTTALAEGLAFLAENLSTVANVAIGAATAFAVFKAGSYVADVGRRIDATRQLRQETIATTRAEVQAASEQRRAAATRVTQLRSVRAELQQQLIAERNLRNEATAAARAAQTTNARRAGLGWQASAVATRQYASALDNARRATANMENIQQRLHSVNGQLTTSTGTLITSTTRYRAATSAAAAASVSFATRLRGLIAAINPLGIAISIGISLLIQLAFRKDAAARAADHMADRESNLGKFIDANTGKIIEQNKALLANERIKARDRAKDAEADYLSARRGLTSVSDPGSRVALPPEARAAVARYRSGGLNASTLAVELESIRKKIDADPRFARGAVGVQYRNSLDYLIGKTGDITTLAREGVSAQAYDRLLQGKGRPGDVKLAQGVGYIDPSGGDVAGSAAGGGGAEKAAGGRKKLADASAEATKRERELQQALDRTDKREDILSRYDDAPRALDRAAKDARELNQLVGETMNGLAKATKDNPLGAGIYTQEMADADARRIQYGVQKPFRDLIRDQERSLEIGRLRAEGYDDEAAALERALSLQDDIGKISAEQYQQILDNERAQLRVNDALESRGRITSLILNQAQEARDIVESVLMGDTSIVGGVKQAINNIARIEVRKFTEQLFAGTDEKIRELLRGQNGVDRAVNLLEKNAQRGGTSVGNFATAVEQATRRIEAAASGGAEKLVGAPTSGPSSSTNLLANTIKNASAKGTSTGFSSAIKSIGAGAGSFLLEGGFGGFSGGGNEKVTKIPIPANDEIVVTGTRAVSRSAKGKGGLPTGAEVYNKIGAAVGGKLDKALGTKFFKGIGGQLGTALQGAGTGMMASSFAKALGIKQSQTGAAIGGALGSVIPGVGPIVGGLVGGTIGGLFKKTKQGGATITANDGVFSTSLFGNSNSAKAAASGAAGSVTERLNSIMDALGATFSGGGGVTIGQRHGDWRVTTGTSLKIKKGAKEFDDDQEGAIAYAVQLMLQRGVIKGISQASVNIIKSGQDMQKAIEKASIIESIPKRLMQLQDPTRFAITELNREFSEMIAILKEGGATAQQFADAQKLYELERARAIEQTTSAIQGYIDEMIGGQSSPLNKGTVYSNASSKFSSTFAAFKAGKADENELLTAAKNFQDASRALFGSGANFFSDFDSIKAMLTEAKNNAGAGADLPGSPFATDTAVQNAINSLNGTTAQQTSTLNGTLQQILAALTANDNGTGGSSLGYLPGLSGIRLDGTNNPLR